MGVELVVFRSETFSYAYFAHSYINQIVYLKGKLPRDERGVKDSPFC